MITVRPGFLSYHDPRGSGLRHLPADTHLFDWLEAMGHDADVITDHDLHAGGVELLAPYKVVMTASHPEYHTKETLDAITAYTERGGRLMYLGGNGFYWRVAVHPEWPGAVEIRRNEGGIRTWAAEPGEYFNSFDGQYGGLWRRNGRPPQQLTGVGFTSQGIFLRVLTTAVNQGPTIPVSHGFLRALKTRFSVTSASAVVVPPVLNSTGRIGVWGRHRMR